tara:strand:+ start:81 stop:311 length:231 start_codon:yes stop_codon:yes gene_type:complete
LSDQKPCNPKSQPALAHRKLAISEVKRLNLFGAKDGSRMGNRLPSIASGIVDRYTHREYSGPSGDLAYPKKQLAID